MAALVTEFVFILHRIEVKLLAFVAIPRQPFQGLFLYIHIVLFFMVTCIAYKDVLKQKRRLVKARSAGVGQEEQLLASCDKNLVSRALLYMQLAVHARGVQRRQMASAWIEVIHAFLCWHVSLFFISLFTCLFICLFACVFICLFVCFLYLLYLFTFICFFILFICILGKF